MEATQQSYTTARPRPTSGFTRLSDVIEEILSDMATRAEGEAGTMRGAIFPHQRQASRDLDLIAEIEGTE